MGGGTSLFSYRGTEEDGLSPRGRGNPFRPPHVPRPVSYGLSPRGRGNPLDLNVLISRLQLTVYPRVGGGTCLRLARVGARVTTGLSPRGRGNQVHAKCQRRTVKSIPAWAGEPEVAAFTTHILRVYPRVGGGTVVYSKSIG